MTMSSQGGTPPSTPAGFAELNEQLLEAKREAARLVIDVYEKTLESLAAFHEEAADRTDVDWIATANRAQARLTRELAKRHGEMGRELLK
jgi:hypothetical protein